LKTLLSSGIGRINIMKMAVLLKAIYRFNAILIKIPFHTSRKINPNLYLKAQKTTNNQSNTGQKEQCWSITPHDFKLYYRVIAI
jgi:hypothetical protein